MDAKESLQRKPLTGVNLTPQHSRKLKTMSLPGQVVVGGYDTVALSSTETFPPLTSATCAVPKLSQTQARTSPTLSLLSNGRLVVCGGRKGSLYLKSCISWIAPEKSWTHIFTMRFLPIIIIMCTLWIGGFYYWPILFTFPQNHRNERAYHTAWTPSSHPDSIVLFGGQDNATRYGTEMIHNMRDGADVVPGEPSTFRCANISRINFLMR